MDKIRITFEWRETDGLKRWYIVDSNIPGLWLWGENLSKLAADVPSTINALRKHNKLTNIPELPE